MTQSWAGLSRAAENAWEDRNNHVEAPLKKDLGASRGRSFPFQLALGKWIKPPEPSPFAKTTMKRPLLLQAAVLRALWPRPPPQVCANAAPAKQRAVAPQVGHEESPHMFATCAAFGPRGLAK